MQLLYGDVSGSKQYLDVKLFDRYYREGGAEVREQRMKGKGQISLDVSYLLADSSIHKTCMYIIENGSTCIFSTAYLTSSLSPAEEDSL